MVDVDGAGRLTDAMTDIGRRLAASATGQHGSFTRRQAIAGGVTRAMLRSRDQSGNLVKIGRNTYSSPFVERTPRADLHALLLDVGDPVFASGPTSAALHGFDGFSLKAPFHVIVPRGRAPQRVGHFVHTSTDLERIDVETTSDGIPVITPTRALIDLARLVTPAALTGALDSALRDGKTSEDFLHRRIAALRGKGRHSLPALVDVIAGAEIIRGGQSWLEREYLSSAAKAGLPRADAQVVLTRAGDRLVRVDCRYPGTRVIVELLGYRWHRSKAQMQRDTERMNRLQLDGFIVLQFTYHDVVERCAEVVALVRLALRAQIGV
ncbi:MAG: hypothetical protein JWN62_1826 [Acidimicrobiales bacterium]|nr:hypothetical protein [Acidimicrobiales bacterium]